MNLPEINSIVDGSDKSMDKVLINLAIQGVSDAVLGTKRNLSFPDSPVIGVFVTVTIHGRLRGCIGFPEGHRNLLYDTYEAGRLAASEDPRFTPVKKDELSNLDIEVTLLGPLTEVDPEKWNGFVRGLHGIVVRSRYSSGLLLPQVAVEYDLSWKEFLNETCMKAGLREGCYKDRDVKVFVFNGRRIIAGAETKEGE